MKNEKILTIIKGQEFKLSLKDKIEINDIFYDQYLEAAAMLENIVANEERDKQPDWKKAETENNIIAFCGERGEGKSSAMFTFINAVVNEKEQKESTIFAQCENVKNTVFSEPIVIDPSAFDNVHNVLDIIIASLYRKFSDKYDVSPERFANYRREELLNEFQKVQLNSEVWYFLNENYKKSDKKYVLPPASFQMERTNCFFWILNWFTTYKNSMFDKKDNKFAYMFEILYTLRLNNLQRSRCYEELGEFIGGYIWGPSFDDIIPNAAGDNPMVRSRFFFSTMSVYNLFSEKVGNAFNITNELLDPNKDYISKLSENDKEKEYKIFNWVMLGLFSNICKEITDNIENPPMVRYIYNSNIIFSNYRLNNPLQICLENYIIGICSLESLYKKLNIEILGISKEDFQKVIRRIENDNSNKIHAFRTIFSNIDLIMRFHEYCWKNRQSKESGNKDERGKTRAVVDRFFRNIERFYREYIDKNFEEKLNNLILRDSDGEEAVINISELYADLLQRSIEESVSFEEKQKQDKVKEMMDSLDFDVQPDEPLQSVSTYLKNKSAENVLKNVKNIIHNMKRYQVRHKDEKVEGDNAGFIIMREYAIDYYQRVAEFWVENPKLDIPEEMSKEYKDIAKDCSKYNEEK